MSKTGVRTVVLQLDIVQKRSNIPKSQSSYAWVAKEFLHTMSKATQRTVTHYAIKIQSTETAILLTYVTLSYSIGVLTASFLQRYIFGFKTVFFFAKVSFFWACHIFCLFFLVEVPPFKR